MVIFVRIVHIRHYDPRLGRFQSTAFKSARGVSVFDRECALAASASTCQHIAHFYSAVPSAPPLYALVPSAELPARTIVSATRSASGDLCHRDISGLTTGDSKALTRKFVDSAVIRCPDGAKPTPAELTVLRSKWEAGLPPVR